MVTATSPSRGRLPSDEEIVIPADDVRLAGTLWMPASGEAEHIAVMVHGSGPMTRDNDIYFPPIRDELPLAGIGVLGRESVAIDEVSAAVSKNDDLTVQVFPGADHRILIDDGFAPGYFETLTSWITRRPAFGRSAR